MEGQVEKNKEDPKRVGPPCLLCRATTTQLFFESKYHRFFECLQCGSPFRDPATFLAPEAEKARYLEHNNDTADPHYQAFAKPVVDVILDRFPTTAKLLDFGSGTGPVVAKLLTDKGYSVSCYDPFFAPNAQLLNDTYDGIICCEVIEHFHQPLQEFQNLYKLLKPGGSLICKTDLDVDTTHFKIWYYKDDPTHVIFYKKENLEWIAAHTPFSEVTIDGRIVVFER
ncbi:class I SAM-dependent methyltransferase [Altibacter sp. HG106]|uniref:class I SAM-dependent methyltransferase n=1 Tax=Altibacter sp. HG106 TaxID=3023937 RepID=UPI0023504704|nr:class I SAM-dependent methyltransferase [Altibacter sp. HG106]MDC7993947.1 class I SAM-dependent methyltransferase [Altibacter sp. HG106]